MTLLLDTLKAFNAGDLETYLARMTPDFARHSAEVPEPLDGKEVWLQDAEMMRRVCPDLEARADDAVAAEEWVALRLTFTGTHEGDFQLGEFQTLAGYRPH